MTRRADPIMLALATAVAVNVLVAVNAYLDASEPPPLMQSGLFPRVQTCREVLVLPECIDLSAPERCAPRRELRCE